MISRVRLLRFGESRPRAYPPARCFLEDYMQYRKLGASGLEVSAIGFGGMPLSVAGDRPGEVDGIAVIHHAIDSGITFLDTADVYCKDSSEINHNERLFGKALKQLPPSQRHAIVVATKGGMTRAGTDWARDGSAKHLRAACDASLKALGVDRIDLYQYHRIDARVPIAESIGIFKELKDQGKIAHVGVSNFGVDELELALKIVPIVSVQNEYSPRHRQPERPTSEADPKLDPNTAGSLQHTQEKGIAFIPWSPIGGMGGAAKLGSTQQEIQAIASAHGVSPQQVALAWMLSKGPMIIPIPGSTKKKNIEDCAKAADLRLSVEEIQRIDVSKTSAA
jgi:aryl-alcohol dehydrogenase-like predicted oxidoreductase